MAEQTQVSQPAETHPAGHTSWLLVTVVAVIAAAIGLGAGYLLLPADSTAEVPADAETLLDDYWEALNAGDADTILALLTDDANFLGIDVATYSEAALRRQIQGWAGSELERVGDPLVAGQYGQYDIAEHVVDPASVVDELFIIETTPSDDGLQIVSFDYIPDPVRLPN